MLSYSKFMTSRDPLKHINSHITKEEARRKRRRELLGKTEEIDQRIKDELKTFSGGLLYE